MLAAFFNVTVLALLPAPPLPPIEKFTDVPWLLPPPAPAVSAAADARADAGAIAGNSAGHTEPAVAAAATETLREQAVRIFTVRCDDAGVGQRHGRRVTRAAAAAAHAEIN